MRKIIKLVDNNHTVQAINKSMTIEWEMGLTTQLQTLEFSIYYGYDSIEELKSYMESLKIRTDCYAIVRFLNMYYCIIFNGYYREMMIGKDIIWYRHHGYMINTTKSEFIKPYGISELSHKIFRHEQVYYDLKEIDSNITVLIEKRGKLTDIMQYQYAKSFVILLGLTFYTSFIDLEYPKLHFLNSYFDFEDYKKIIKKPYIIGINPFISRFKTKNGTIEQYKYTISKPNNYMS